jgi:hypothetical protein
MPIDPRLAATIDALDLEFEGDRTKIMDALLEAKKTDRGLADALQEAGPDVLATYRAKLDAELDEAVQAMERFLRDDPERAEVAAIVSEYLNRMN